MNSNPVVQDGPGLPGVKRPCLVCRYFLNTWGCFHGSKCQYSHEMLTSQPAAMAIAGHVSQGPEGGSYWLQFNFRFITVHQLFSTINHLCSLKKSVEKGDIWFGRHQGVNGIDWLHLAQSPMSHDRSHKSSSIT